MRSGRVVALACALAIGATVAVVMVVPYAGARSSGQALAKRYMPVGNHAVTPPGAGAQHGVLSAPGVSVTPALSQAIAALSGHAEGTLNPSSAVALLSGLPIGDGTLYGVTTSTGAVCLVLTPGPQGCTDTFTQQSPVSFSMFNPDGFGTGQQPTSIIGLTPDDVTAIDVVSSDGTSSVARLAHDAYFATEPVGSAAYPTSLRIHYSDGTSLTFPIPTPAG